MQIELMRGMENNDFENGCCMVFEQGSWNVLRREAQVEQHRRRDDDDIGRDAVAASMDKNKMHVRRLLSWTWFGE